MTEPNDWNARIIEEFRAYEGRVGGQFEGAPLLLLHSIGARSGKERVNPMMYPAVGDAYAEAALSGIRRLRGEHDPADPSSHPRTRQLTSAVRSTLPLTLKQTAARATLAEVPIPSTHTVPNLRSTRSGQIGTSDRWPDQSAGWSWPPRGAWFVDLG